MPIFYYPLVGLVAGVFSGLVGIGGGIIIVPALVYLFGFTQQTAQGTTLGLLLFPIGILGALEYYRQGHVDFRVVVLIALGFILGSLFGAKFALMLPAAVLKRIFGCVLLLIGIKMIWGG
ncbi:MAG TPA: sulfite exporter TauE/SafE family protein [Oculatellaceae cyanobacterium]|jgi:uncharacterized membrane protein YfcA